MDSLRVLIVDDALFMRAMIRDILEQTGRFTVVGEASNGIEALAMFHELRPDLVTMDIVMPEMDGIQATRELVKFDPSATVVICSALGQEDLVIEAIAAGARDFIVKPFASEKVMQVLATILPVA